MQPEVSQFEIVTVERERTYPKGWECRIHVPRTDDYGRVLNVGSWNRSGPEGADSGVLVSAQDPATLRAFAKCLEDAANRIEIARSKNP